MSWTEVGNSKMKIGLVIEYFDPRRGGAEHWTFQLAERLLKRGYEVHVVSQGFGPDAARLPIVAHELGAISSRLGRAKAAEKKLRSLTLDVIHDVGMGWFCDVFQSQDGSRIAQWERKLLLLPPWARPFKRQMVRVLPRYREFRKLAAGQFADPGRIMLAVSKMVARDYQHYHAVRPEQIRVVYNGVDTHRFSPAHRQIHRESVRGRLDVGAKEVVFLFVGHDFRRKGLATALRAIGRLLAGGAPVRLIVAGGKRTGRYVRMARRCRASRAVTFLGPIGDPVPYYAAADACVLPTFYDPCSLVVLEAAASGLPSVTTRANGAGELLTDGVDGFLLRDPGNDEELADRLGDLLHPAVRRRMEDAARQLALQHTLDRSCDQIVDVYHEIARSQRRAA